VVTLAGSVNSAEAKDRATAIAQSVPDVSSVVNSLQVAGG
jgi:osmotically-inducible protein OsmY